MAPAKGPRPSSSATAPDRPKRRYSSERRGRQAAQTRADVLAAAVELFAERGWGGTTLAAIAEQAGVAVETVYSGFRSKKGLLRAAMEVAVVGDADEIPFVERDEFRRFGEGPLDERLATMAAVVAEIHERSSGVWRAILEASSGDAEVDGWRAELEQGRRLDTGRSIERLTGRAAPPTTVDVVWALVGPETYLKLTRDAGMDRPTYERALADAVRRLVT